jgi:hypothetical protein
MFREVIMIFVNCCFNDAWDFLTGHATVYISQSCDMGAFSFIRNRLVICGHYLAMAVI